MLWVLIWATAIIICSVAIICACVLEIHEINHSTKKTCCRTCIIRDECKEADL